MDSVSVARPGLEASPSSTAVPVVAGSRVQVGLLDMWHGVVAWRTWWVLAANDIKQRYRRSKLGQLWLTLSMAVSILGLAIVFGVIFNSPLEVYLPYLGIGLIVWGLIAGLVNDLATAYVNAGTYLTSYPGPKSAVIYRTITRNAIMTAHNLVMVPVIIVVLKVPVSFATLLAIPGLLLILVNAVWLGMVLGPLCARFRDLPQLVVNIMQLMFFLSPIIYRPEQIMDRLWVLTHLNPFASFLEVVRAPLLGQVPELRHYLVILVVTAVGFAVALPFYGRFRGRIIYWL